MGEGVLDVGLHLVLLFGSDRDVSLTGVHEL